MDRITKALELAREKRGTLGGGHAAALQPAVLAGDTTHGLVREVEISPEFLREQKIISGFSDQPMADSYRLLRTRLLQRMRQNGWTTLGVTSTAPNAGKTLTSINLGVAIAMDSNHSVLLVDVDLRKPDVHKVFGITPEYGLVEYLTSNVSLADVLISPGIERFVFLPCVEKTQGTSEMLATKKMVHLVEQLKAQSPSRIVIFDLPPILVGDDVVAFSSNLDAVLLVVEDGKTDSRHLARAAELLEGTHLIGTVLNKSRESVAEHYGHYGY